MNIKQERSSSRCFKGLYLEAFLSASLRDSPMLVHSINTPFLLWLHLSVCKHRNLPYLGLYSQGGWGDGTPRGDVYISCHLLHLSAAAEEAQREQITHTHTHTLLLIDVRATGSSQNQGWEENLSKYRTTQVQYYCKGNYNHLFFLCSIRKHPWRASWPVTPDGLNT